MLAEQAQEDYCLGLLLEHPAAWAEVYGILGEGDFAGTETRALYGAWLRASRNSPSLESHAFLTELPTVLQAAAERARARVARETLPDDDAALAKAARSAAYRLKRMRLKAEMAEVDYLERDAEGTGDPEAARALLQRKQQLLMQRRALDAASGLHG